MPPEIRDRVWRLVIGDRLIHFGQESLSRNVVCHCDHPENEWPQEDVKWRQSHLRCEDKLIQVLGHALSSIEDRGHYPPGIESMHLTALRVCRQVYNEAKFVLWTTNTFSFMDGPTTAFPTFMESRTMRQTQLLKKLRLQMDWNYHLEENWDRNLGMPLIRSLTGLKTLRLQINRPLEAEYPPRWGAQSDTLKVLQTRPGGLLDRLGILPLTDVEVLFHNFQQDVLPYGPWTVQDRTEYAQEVQRRLLDPKGPEIYAQNQKKIRDAYCCIERIEKA